MCGIIGIASKEPINNRDWLIKGRDAMMHRGPDDAGIWWSDNNTVGLGHRRLSIIDLSPAGHQPMHNSRGNLTITFNGEIYNYPELRSALIKKNHLFESNSDTEVILAAYDEWGNDCVKYLNGMFAFAIYNAKTQDVFMARDRAGEKPFYYSWKTGEIRFASELKGLMADSTFYKSINYEALNCYLSIGYIPNELCIINDINKLPPGHAMIFNCAEGSLNSWRYWDLPKSDNLLKSNNINERLLLNELENLVEDAVKKQLEADVSVGVLLSGGLDSSLITAMAARHSSKIKTFNVGFPNYSHYDESKHAKLVANYFGTEHIELYANDINPEIMSVLAKQYDEPIIDSSMIPTYLVSQLVKQHCSVALGGDGGDELFGGYTNYSRLLWTQEKFGSIPIGIRKIISTLGRYLPTGYKGRYLLQSVGTDFANSLPSIATHFDAQLRRKLLINNKWNPDTEHNYFNSIPKTTDLLERTTRMDFYNYMAEDILVKVDRASMLSSLEIRAPLLDYRVIEFAFNRVPSSLKTTTTQRKILLKMLGAKILPPEFDLQRKQGFSIPLPDWLKKGPWRDLFYDTLQNNQSLFDKRITNELLKGQDMGKKNSERLFGLVIFELWRQEYKI